MSMSDEYEQNQSDSEAAEEVKIDRSAEPDTDPEENGPDTDKDEGEDTEEITLDSAGVLTRGDGTKVYTRTHSYPVSNAEQAQYELTHEGDQERYHLKPGEKNYSPEADPAVTSSYLARMVTSEIASYPERFADDPDASVSPMWDGLHKTFEGNLKHAIATDVGNSVVTL